MVPLSYYLVLSAILFACGVAGFLIKRNIITIFLSIELMLNGVNLSFVAFAAQLTRTQYMEQVKLGSQGALVSRIGLGCMGMSEFYGQREGVVSLLRRLCGHFLWNLGSGSGSRQIARCGRLQYVSISSIPDSTEQHDSQVQNDLRPGFGPPHPG